MGETGIEGVVGAQTQVYEMPAPVKEHEPLANVDPEVRGIIIGNKRESSQGAMTSGTYIEKRMKDNDMDLKQLTYVGRNPLVKAYFEFCYSLSLKDPVVELEKIRSGVEERIAEDQKMIDTLDDVVQDINNQLDGMDKDGEVVNKYAARKLMNSAEAMVLEYEEALNNEQRQKSEEEVKAQEIKQQYFSIKGNDAESRQKATELADLYRAFDQNVQQRKTKIDGLQEKLATVSAKFNIYYDNVERAEAYKARILGQKDTILQDKATLEGVSYDLKFLANMNTGAIKTVRTIANNQAALVSYKRLVDGLEKVFKTQGEIMRDVPNLIDSNRRRVKRQKDEETGRLNRSKENEIHLAKQRIQSKSAGLGI